MLKPVGNRILVRRQEPVKKTKGGIELPDTAQKKLFRGTVLAVGPGKYADGCFLPTCPEPLDAGGTVSPMEPHTACYGVAVGSEVVFGEWSGHEVEEGDEKLVVLEEDDVLLVVVPDPQQTADAAEVAAGKAAAFQPAPAAP